MKWWITVHGYGAFEFEGSESDAEEMRVHKAQWEGGIARKWQIGDNGVIIPRDALHHNLPPSRDHNDAQYDILAAEIAEAMLTGAEKEDVEHEQHYRGLSREWWLNFWEGWLMEEISSVGVAQDTGALAREIYDARSAKA